MVAFMVLITDNPQPSNSSSGYLMDMDTVTIALAAVMFVCRAEANWLLGESNHQCSEAGVCNDVIWPRQVFIYAPTVLKTARTHQSINHQELSHKLNI